MATQRTFTTEEAQKKMAALPPEVQDILYSDEMSNTIQKVGEKNKLHYDQMGRLEMETTNVLLGFTETADLQGILAQVLSVDEGIAETIVSDLNELLFSRIRNSMKETTKEPEKAISSPSAMAMSVAIEEKSVVMPSSIAKTVGAEMGHASSPAPVTPPVVPTPAPAAPTTPVATPASSIPSTTPTIPAPAAVPVSNQVTIPVAVPKPAVIPTAMPKVDTMLSQATVSLAPSAPTTPTSTPVVPNITMPPGEAGPSTSSGQASVTPPKPGPIYKTDPYHEPID